MFDELILRSITVDTHPTTAILTQKKLHNTNLNYSSTDWTINVTIHVDGGQPNTVVRGVIVSLQLNDQPLIYQQQQNNDSKLFHKFDIHLDHNGEGQINNLIVILINKQSQSNNSNTFNIIPWYPNGSPNGHRQKQHLYTFTATIVQQSNYQTSKLINIGFRTVKLVQERFNKFQNNNTDPYSFFFTVNEQAIYSKGSNWVPAHVLNEALSGGYIRQLFRSAWLANMNMLRVWGGGLYESDLFYQLADEYGILIWQDLMFACALYPTDPEFLQSVSTEIRQQVRRLQHHPSIILWSGS